MTPSLATSPSGKFYDVIVIGGGASGLMCAQVAGKRGRSVLVLDSSNKVGKKILMSGGGRCNFTNLYVEPENYISQNPHFCKSALSRYTQWDFISLVEHYDIPYHERLHGELFCNDSAKDILSLLLSECSSAKVDIKTKCIVDTVTTVIERNDTDAIANESIENSCRYQLQSNLGNFSCHSLVIATGGLSIPTMGSSGFGYDIAKQFGLNILPRRAGLVPFTFSDATKAMTERLSGLALDVSMYTEKQTFRENMLFTHRGISGPTALQLSNYWDLGETIKIDLLPNEDIEALLLTAKAEQANALLRTVLSKQLSKSLVLELQELIWKEHTEKPIGQHSDASLKHIAQTLRHWQLKPSGTEGYRTAEVTLGGIDTNEISSKTMESKAQAGLFFIGEVLDVTGHLGGFNFQWAWASGVAAGESV